MLGSILLRVARSFLRPEHLRGLLLALPYLVSISLPEKLLVQFLWVNIESSKTSLFPVKMV